MQIYCQQLLQLLQLASPLLPVGGYSYSEGLESLILQGKIGDRSTLKTWIDRELQAGAIGIETAVMARSYQACCQLNSAGLNYWNNWLTAARETEELRLQSWQMGGSLIKLAIEITPEIKALSESIEHSCHYAIAFGITAQFWQIDRRAAILAYLHSWTSNQVSVGIKSIPLGQTAGQQILWQLQHSIELRSQTILDLADEDLYACSWGSTLASMQHETLYSRLFRS
ncbi:urease accessory protein UreF [Chamaesiphon sp. VAR_69_metabat_338]|uniref:urease accessory protein UreF n=1 Tax=Chamaesiphon sp. VAR_69_metabat_338 TaxID=2964704 RepID=UPI0037BFF19E